MQLVHIEISSQIYNLPGAVEGLKLGNLTRSTMVKIQAFWRLMTFMTNPWELPLLDLLYCDSFIVGFHDAKNDKTLWIKKLSWSGAPQGGLGHGLHGQLWRRRGTSVLQVVTWPLVHKYCKFWIIILTSFSECLVMRGKHLSTKSTKLGKEKDRGQCG